MKRACHPGHPATRRREHHESVLVPVRPGWSHALVIAADEQLVPWLGHDPEWHGVWSEGDPIGSSKSGTRTSRCPESMIRAQAAAPDTIRARARSTPPAWPPRGAVMVKQKHVE